jgi:imidazolonepropionase-like amidohydrolase
MSRLRLLLVIILVLLLCAGCSANQSKSFYLTNCRMIDGTGAPPVDNAVIAVKDGHIAEVGTNESIAIPEVIKVIDLKGATVMPGFINAHVHQSYNEKNLENWLKDGVTTVRDESPLATTDFLKKRDRLNNDPKHSRIISASYILSPEGGYGQDFYTSPETASELVNRYIDMGVDSIKFSIEDDMASSTWTLPTYEEVKAIVDTTHESGYKVSVHIGHERNLQWAIDAGVDDIAHMVVEPISLETAGQVAQKGIYWVPTLEIWNGVSQDYGLDWVDVAVENLSVFYEAGGKIALGTDFAGYEGSFDPGFPVTEVNLMKRAGMSPMDIIVAGTKNAAYVCGVDSILGTIEAGKIADLLVVNGDPLTEMPNWSVRMVVHGGKIVVDDRDVC